MPCLGMIKFDNGSSPSGKALGFGPSIRRFESCRPSQEIKWTISPLYFLVDSPELVGFRFVIERSEITFPAGLFGCYDYRDGRKTNIYAANNQTK